MPLSAITLVFVNFITQHAVTDINQSINKSMNQRVVLIAEIFKG